jgi:hypothetical protein
MPSSRQGRGQRRRQRSQISVGTKEEESALTYQYCDLNVPLMLDTSFRNNHASNNNYHNGNGTTINPNNTSSKKSKNNPKIKRRSNEEQYALIQRLKQTGYSVIAMSHSITGKFNLDRDIASRTMPSSLYSSVDTSSQESKGGGKNNDNSSSCNNNNNKRVKLLGTENRLFVSSAGKNHNGNRSGSRGEACHILKRLNVCIEEAPDLGIYCSNAPNEATSDALKSYDIIAMSPQNDKSFSSICNMSNLYYCDIITLDYTSGKGGGSGGACQLPYKIRVSDVRAATNRGIVFELPYGPALTDPSKRKAFIQTARSFLNACVGVKDDHHQPPKIIISSGERVFENKDHGVMALRTPGDMINFTNLVLEFGQQLSTHAFSSNALWAVQRGRNRRMGKVVSSSSVTFRKGVLKCLNFEVVDSIPDSILNAASESKNNENISESVIDMVVEDDDEVLESKKSIVEFDHEEDFLKL